MSLWNTEYMELPEWKRLADWRYLSSFPLCFGWSISHIILGVTSQQWSPCLRSPLALPSCYSWHRVNKLWLWRLWLEGSDQEPLCFQWPVVKIFAAGQTQINGRPNWATGVGNFSICFIHIHIGTTIPNYVINF